MKRLNRQKLVVCVVALVVAPVVGYTYDLLTTGGNLSRGLVTMLWDARTGKPLLLDEAVSTTVPDGRSSSVVAPSGRVRWYELHSKRVFAGVTVSPENYRRVQVLWLSGHQVAVSEEIRYPTLAGNPVILLDRDREKVQDRVALNRAAELFNKKD